MIKSNNGETKIILLIFSVFAILSLLILFMLIRNGYFSSQFYFNHMPITYSFEQGIDSNSRVCSEAQNERIDEAFRIIQNATSDAVIFLKVIPSNEDISIYCAGIDNGNLTYFSNSVFKVSTFMVTEAQSQFSHRGNIIKKAAITFYLHKNCGTFPDVEIHEILHVLGFGHKDDKKSIMYPLSLVCDRDSIDAEILKEIIDIYR